MKKYSAFIILFFLFIFLISCNQQKDSSENEKSTAQSVTQTDDLTSLAKRFVTYLVNEDAKKAVENFDSAMKSQLSEEKLKEIWQSLIAQSGAFKKQTSTRNEKIQIYEVVYVTCELEKTTLDVKIVFNNSKQISGLFFVPTQSGSAGNTSSQKDSMPDSITEKNINVGTGEWVLPGTLTLPKGNGPFPVVILVHGSGPNDRDESIGPNKPFKDIAWGLASDGIAVLRYEKRTKQYADKYSSSTDITVKEETIDDALEAVSLMRNTDSIDKNNIFVLGHSLGGMLVPRIGLQDQSIKGLVVLAGASRPLEDLILEQTEYILSLDKSISDQNKKEKLDQIKTQVQKIKDTNLSLSTPANELFGIPAKYWLDIRGYNPPQTAKNLKQPMIILQGERDYQVTLKDFELWKTGLSSKKNVDFKTYPNLNHLFMKGSGKSIPQEYNNPGNVDDTVIADISNWVKSN